MNTDILRIKLRLSIGVIGLLKYGTPWLLDSNKKSTIEYHEQIVKTIKQKLLLGDGPAPVNNVIPIEHTKINV